MKMKSLSHVQLLATPWKTTSPSIGFSRQEYWSGVPLPSLKEDWGLKNWCFQTVVLEKALESPLDSKETKPVNPKEKSTLNIHSKDWCWSSNTLATWCKEPTQLKRPWCWERLRAGGEGGDRGWDGWMASPIQWTWVSAISRRQWTGKSCVLQSIEKQRVRHDLMTEQQNPVLLS